MPPSATTKLVVVREGVETDVEIDRWVAKDSVISFRALFGEGRRLADALGGELLYDSVSFSLRFEGVEYRCCRVEAWYRNGTVVIRVAS